VASYDGPLRKLRSYARNQTLNIWREGLFWRQLRLRPQRHAFGIAFDEVISVNRVAFLNIDFFSRISGILNERVLLEPALLLAAD
jgi:hypothetical protein